MSIIIFLILPIFVVGFYGVEIDLKYSLNVDYFLKQKENEYLVILGYLESSILNIKLNFDNLIIIDKKYFKDQIRYFKKLGKNTNFYTFYYYSIIEKKRLTNRVEFGTVLNRMFLDQAYSNDSMLIGTCDYNFVNDMYEIKLNLIKSPYKEVSKILSIDSLLNRREDFSIK